MYTVYMYIPINVWFWPTLDIAAAQSGGWSVVVNVPASLQARLGVCLTAITRP
jgi:hypothetical protein